MKCSIFLASLILAACSPVSGSDVREAPDSKNRVSRFGLKEMPDYDAIKDITSVRTTVTPWSDIYWALTDKGLARRWATLGMRSLFGVADFWRVQKNVSEPNQVDPYLSPAEKYDIAFRERHRIKVSDAAWERELRLLEEEEAKLQDLHNLDAKRKAVASLQGALASAKNLQRWSPMAYNDWNTYLTYTKNPKYQFLAEKDSGANWTWMGYCHGWAAAATMAEAPKHSVMARIGDKEIFFSEGDIRGLLTKAWADHAPKNIQYFLGRRCNEKVDAPEGVIPHDGSGRGITGTLMSGGKIRNFIVVDEYLPASALVSGKRVYQIRFEDEDKAYYLLEKDATSYFLADNRGDSRLFVEKGQTAGTKTLGEVKFYGCWDVNPASLHTLLTQYLPKEDVGFVMDRTRTGQVWNHPIYGADFELGPLERADSVDDVAFMHRAEDTVYLMVVKARLFWSSGPRAPVFDYASDFDKKQISTLDYVYTLEFDSDKKLIGGEWGDLHGISPSQVTPDFLFGFKKNSLPVDDLNASFDYSGVIGPIHACSLKEENMTTGIFNGKEISYAVCDLKSAE